MEASTPQAGNNTAPLDNYLTSFFKSQQYQNLSAYDKQRAVEYLHSTKVEPYFGKLGLRSPGIQYVNTLAAPYTGPDKSQPESKTGVKTQFAAGVAEGFFQGAGGVVKAAVKYDPFAWASEHVEKALYGTNYISEGREDFQNRLSLVRADISDFFDNNYGKPDTLGTKVARGGGELVGQLPYWNRIAGAVKVLPWVGEAAEGTLLTRLKLLQTAGQDARVVTEAVAPLAQKSAAMALEGGAVAAGLGEEPKTIAEWAAGGAVLPVIGAMGSKLWTALKGTRGSAGVGNVIKQGLNLAKTPAAQRPTATSLTDIIAGSVAKVVDENGPKAAAQKIAAATETLDAATAVETAKTQFEATRQASQVATQTNSAVAGIAKAAGVKAPVEHAAQDAEESVTKGTIAETLTPKDTTKLPNTLAGAKPRHTTNTVEFESDIDKALYIVAQDIKSKSDSSYMAWLQKQFPDKTEAEIRAMGKSIRINIRGHADNLADGETVIKMPASNYTKKPQTVSQTVPETTNALDSQLQAVANGDKAAVAWTPGKGPSATIPSHLKAITLKGQVIVYNPKVSNLTGEKIKAMVMDNRLHEVLGYPVSKETVAKAVAAGEKPVVVTAKDAVTGSEVQSTVASTSSAPATIEATKAAHPTSKVEVKPAQVAGEINLERIRGELSHNYNNMIAAEQGATMSAVLGKAHTPVDIAKREGVISDLAKQFIEAGGSKEELDKLMADFEINRHAKIAAAKEYAAKAIAKKAAGQAVAPATTPEVVAKTALSKAEELKRQAAIANEVVTGAKTIKAPESNAGTPGPGFVDAVAKAAEIIKAAGKKVTATGASAEDVKASRQTIRFELNDLGLNSQDDVYRRVLAQFGFKKAEEVPAHLLNDVREALRAAKIKTSTFDEVEVEGQKVYKLNPTGEGETKLSPTKVFDATNGYDPNFVHEVSLAHPDIVGGRSLGDLKAWDVFEDLAKKLGPEETDKFLAKLGYDAVTMGKPGKAAAGEEPQYFVQMLTDAVKNVATEKAEQLAEAAANTGIRTEQEGTSAVDAAERARAILDNLKAKKKATLPKMGPGAANIKEPTFSVNSETAVTSEELAQRDTDFFKQAKAEMGENANVSLLLARAQELKKAAAKGK